jgi:hypothetical protein
MPDRDLLVSAFRREWSLATVRVPLINEGFRPGA